MRRSILSAAAPACLLIGLTPVAASADPAPTGAATGPSIWAPPPTSRPVEDQTSPKGAVKMLLHASMYGDKAMLAKVSHGENLANTYGAAVAVWQFSTNLTLVALSGEVVSDYVPLIEQAIGPLQLWLSAYCNDVFGYFPSARVLKEGGYEAVDSMIYYGQSGPFAPDVEDRVLAAVHRVMKDVGR